MPWYTIFSVIYKCTQNQNITSEITYQQILAMMTLLSYTQNN